MGARSSSESSMVSSTFGESNTADFNEDTEYLIRSDQKPAVRYTTRQMFLSSPSLEIFSASVERCFAKLQNLSRNLESLRFSQDAWLFNHKGRNREISAMNCKTSILEFVQLILGIFFHRMWEQLKRRSSYQALPTVEPRKDFYRDLHHPVFQSIRVVQVCNPFSRGWLPNLTQISFQMDEERNSIIQTQTIVSLSKVMTAKAMQQCLMFIYTGSIEQEFLQLEVIYCFNSHRKFYSFSSVGKVRL